MRVLWFISIIQNYHPVSLWNCSHRRTEWLPTWTSSMPCNFSNLILIPKFFKNSVLTFLVLVDGPLTWTPAIWYLSPGMWYMEILIISCIGLFFILPLHESLEVQDLVHYWLSFAKGSTWVDAMIWIEIVMWQSMWSSCLDPFTASRKLRREATLSFCCMCK